MLPPSLPPSQHLQPSQSSSYNHDVCDAQDDFASSSTSSQFKTLDPAVKKPRTKKSKVVHEVEDGTDQENARAREQRKAERAAKRARKAAKMERREMERVKFEWAEALEVEWKPTKRDAGEEESDFEEELDSTTREFTRSLPLLPVVNRLILNSSVFSFFSSNSSSPRLVDWSKTSPSQSICTDPHRTSCDPSPLLQRPYTIQDASFRYIQRAPQSASSKPVLPILHPPLLSARRQLGRRLDSDPRRNLRYLEPSVLRMPHQTRCYLWGRLLAQLVLRELRQMRPTRRPFWCRPR